MSNRLNPPAVIPALFITLLLASLSLAADLKPVRVEGVLIEKENQSFRLLDAGGTETLVRVTETTEIIEGRKNFLREPRGFQMSDLRSGLRLMVKGIPDQNGVIEAIRIKFTNKARKMAIVMDSALVPVESRLADLQQRNQQIENNLEDFQQSYQETRRDLSRVKVTANRADGKADQAVASAETAHSRIGRNEDRVTDLRERLELINDFFVTDENIILFGPGSSELTAEARSTLDKLGQTLQEGGTLVEVIGFASSDGNKAFNRRLSQNRAETVQRYLIENHGVELRRFVSPFGLGELRPVADNQTKEGRQQNRRAEIRVLSSRGLERKADPASPSGGQ